MTVTILQPRVPLGDPHDCTDAADELCILGAIYDTLLRRDGTGFTPALAESWQVSDDARTWSFHLREGVTFHDGSPCDAAAVQASLERMDREDKGYTLGSPAVWRQYLNGAEYTAEGLDLTVRLAEPMADFPDVLVQGFIVAPSAFAALDAGDPTAHCGTGPYRLAARSDDEIRLEAVDAAHWPAPENPSLIWRCEPDADARRRAVEAGSAHVATTVAPDSEITTGTLIRYRAPVAIIYLLNAAKGPLKDPRIRRALTLAVDRNALIDDVMNGQAKPLRGFVSPAHFGADATAGASRDPDTARALLAEAGHAGGLTLAVDCPTRLPDEAPELTQALADQLAEVGITLDIHMHEDREAYAHMVRRKEIRDLCVFDSSPMSTFRVLYEKIDSRVAGAWWQGYANPAVEDLIDRGRRTTDGDQRAALYRQAYRLLQEDPPWLTLYNPMRAILLAGRHPDFTMPVDGVPDMRALPRMEGN
ncbi:ABC transporter substrate-binding protein [Lutimaribacter marinistellae]|uniref:ABC transporter substrate-binding protein n=1 Tax=Lutimaribacter marinistellae TaxID=1820329 RepID=A0ABV7TDY2_9RHOB